MGGKKKRKSEYSWERSQPMSLHLRRFLRSRPSFRLTVQEGVGRRKGGCRAHAVGPAGLLFSSLSHSSTAGKGVPTLNSTVRTCLQALRIFVVVVVVVVFWVVLLVFSCCVVAVYILLLVGGGRKLGGGGGRKGRSRKLTTTDGASVRCSDRYLSFTNKRLLFSPRPPFLLYYNHNLYLCFCCRPPLSFLHTHTPPSRFPPATQGGGGDEWGEQRPAGWSHARAKHTNEQKTWKMEIGVGEGGMWRGRRVGGEKSEGERGMEVEWVCGGGGLMLSLPFHEPATRRQITTTTFSEGSPQGRSRTALAAAAGSPRGADRRRRRHPGSGVRPAAVAAPCCSPKGRRDRGRSRPRRCLLLRPLRCRRPCCRGARGAAAAGTRAGRGSGGEGAGRRRPGRRGWGGRRGRRAEGASALRRFSARRTVN